MGERQQEARRRQLVHEEQMRVSQRQNELWSIANEEFESSRTTRIDALEERQLLRSIAASLLFLVNKERYE